MKISAYLLVITSLISYSAFAVENVEANDESQILASCRDLMVTPGHESAKPCIYFIQGFLGAAQASAPPAINKKNEDRKAYSFMSRPSPFINKKPPVRFIPFCVPDDEPETRVINIISKQLLPPIDTPKILREVIFSTLKTEYPCK